MIYFWIALTVALIIVEAVTTQLVTIWFAVGSIGALLVNIAGLEPVWQWSIFIGLSLVTLIITRPFVRKVTKHKIQPTNADRCLGMDAVVTEAIDNQLGKGQVTVNGMTWTARSLDEAPIHSGETVKIERIDGVKVIVSHKAAAVMKE